MKIAPIAKTLCWYLVIAAVAGGVIEVSVQQFDAARGLATVHNPPIALEIYCEHSGVRYFVGWFMCFAFACLGASIWLLVIGKGHRDNRNLHAAIWLLWLIVPPLWFVIEYFWVFPRWGNPAGMESLKVGQGVAEKLWAAGVAMATGVLFNDLRKEREKEKEKEKESEEDKEREEEKRLAGGVTVSLPATEQTSKEPAAAPGAAR